MLKKIIGISICLFVFTLFNIPSANAAFTWFGFRNDNTEVMVNSTDEPHRFLWFDHHPKKAPKHHPPKGPTHHPHKKGPKRHKWWWDKK